MHSLVLHCSGHGLGAEVALQLHTPLDSLGALALPNEDNKHIVGVIHERSEFLDLFHVKSAFAVARGGQVLEKDGSRVLLAVICFLPLPVEVCPVFQLFLDGIFTS